MATLASESGKTVEQWVTRKEKILQKTQKTIRLMAETFKDGDPPFRIFLIHPQGLIPEETVTYVWRKVKAIVPKNSHIRLAKGPDWIELHKTVERCIVTKSSSS
jgi:hypothetical protein